MEVKELVQKHGEYVVEMRRYFHENPELSWEEFETTKKIAEELDKIGIPYEVNEERKSGVVGVIEGKKGAGRTVALRADIDALPVQEDTGLPFASKNEGVMHACGHDCHTAMLLGAAKILKDMEDEIEGKIYLVFQPSEEAGGLENSGAAVMKKFGNWYSETEAIYGSHIISSGLPTGVISVQPGERMAAAAGFDIEIVGKGAHGSSPHMGIDPIVVAAQIIISLQLLVTRKYSSTDPFVINIGSVNSGKAFNVVPETATMSGTVRYLNPEIRKTAEDDIRNVVDNICALYGAKGTLDYREQVLATYNDKALSEIAKGSVGKVMGERAAIEIPKVMGGEDFSFYLEEKPGVFGLLGGDHMDRENYPNHSPKFNPNEQALPLGAGVYAQFAIDFLNNK